MFKFLLFWLLANYSYENLSNTYKTYHSENPIQEMTSFIEKQQFREDQLREHCNLQNFVIKDKPTYYDTILNNVFDVKDTLTTSLYKNLIDNLNYPELTTTEQMNATTYDDFMNLSHSSDNEDKIITYEDISYTLIRAGVKVEANVYSYSNQQFYPIPKNPTWTIQIGEHILTITDIK